MAAKTLRQLATTATIFAVLALLSAAVYWRPSRAGWHAPSFALQLDALGAELFFMDVPQLVRSGPSRLVVVRFNRPVAFVPHTVQSQKLAAPQPIEAWAKQLGAQLLFNAGQFDANLQHLGWLKGRGRWLSRARKPAWKGLLVSGPLQRGMGPYAQLLDLSQQDGAIVHNYANAVQSMMLIDDAAQVRVRRSQTAACRTVVAQDAQGRLLLLASEGAITLHELASWLPTGGLQVVRAMNLDGGMESQLAVTTPQMQLMLYGQYGSDGRLARLPQAGPVRVALPAVIAVYPAAQVP